jgi:hypothetical protein
MNTKSTFYRMAAVAVLGLALSAAPTGAAEGSLSGRHAANGRRSSVLREIAAAARDVWAWLKCGVTIDPNGACKASQQEPTPAAQTDREGTIDPSRPL